MVSPGLFDALARGIVTGSVIAAGALGLSLIYSIAEVPNFAHGDMITIGAYLALVFNNPSAIPFVPDFGSLSLLVSAIIALVLAGVFGATYEYVIFRRFRENNADLITMVIVSLGLAFILRNVVLFLVGSKNIAYQTERIVNTNFDLYLTGAGLTVQTTQRQDGVLTLTGEWGYPYWLLLGTAITAAGIALAVTRWRRRDAGFATVYLVPPRVLGAGVGVATVGAIGILGRLESHDTATAIASTRVGLNIKYVVIVVTALVAMLLLNVVLKRTKYGKAMRATADNMSLAEVRGVRVDRVQLLVWTVAGVLTALAGVLIGWFASNLSPNTGFNLLLPIFAAVILGGISSPAGAVIGGYVIGLCLDLSVFLLPSEFAVYRTSVAFVILIGVLLIKPEGLRGEV